jgi:hypothetical protein
MVLVKVAIMARLVALPVPFEGTRSRRYIKNEELTQFVDNHGKDDAMLNLIMLALGLLAGAVAVRLRREQSGRSFEQFYAMVVLVSIGLGLILFGFIPHVFFPDYIARNIGWPTGNPFQQEVGYYDGCFGLLGLLSYRYRRGFMQATVIGLTLFLLLAGTNHLLEMIAKANYAPYNVQYILGDLLPAFVYMFLAVKYKRFLSRMDHTNRLI